jgi:peptide chain release factor subunit 1
MTCLKCGTGNYEIVETEDLIEVLVRMAEKANARLEIISTHTEEGEMLIRSFGGIAAITKYRTY